MTDSHSRLKRLAIQAGEPMPGTDKDADATPMTDKFASVPHEGWFPDEFTRKVLKSWAVFARQLERALSAKEAELRAAKDKAEVVADLHAMQMAAIGVLSTSNTKESFDNRIAKDHPYWTPAYEDVATAIAREIAERTAREQAEQRLVAVEARLDAVMMEYCPNEITQEQIENWKAHQRPATAEETAVIKAALAAKKEGGS